MKCFVMDDFKRHACTQDEIGSPWSDRWNIEDLVDGLCDETMVGKDKTSEQLSADEPILLTAEIIADAIAAGIDPDTNILGVYRMLWRRDPHGFGKSHPAFTKMLVDEDTALANAKKDAGGGLRTMALEKINQKGSNAALHRLIVSTLTDDDAEVAHRVQAALALEPHELAMMMGSLSDTLPEPLRVSLGKRCFEPVVG